MNGFPNSTAPNRWSRLLMTRNGGTLRLPPASIVPQRPFPPQDRWGRRITRLKSFKLIFNMNIIKSLAKLDWLTEYVFKIARFLHRCIPAAHRSRCLFMDLFITMLAYSRFFAVGVRKLRSNFAKDEAASRSNCEELRRPQHMFSIVLNNTRKITIFLLTCNKKVTI